MLRTQRRKTVSPHNLTLRITGVNNIETGTVNKGQVAWEFGAGVPKEGTAEPTPER